MGSSPTRRIRYDPAEDVARVRELAVYGLNHSQIARLTGVSRSTIRAWLKTDSERTCEADVPGMGHEPHEFDRLPEREYSYLLGVYLGDGMISLLKHKRCVKLRIFMDIAYPRIIAEVTRRCGLSCRRSIASVQPHRLQNCVEIHSYSNAWPCLFPQHGPGPKHERKIELARWQEAIVDREPEQFIRGLIHSDGCRATNRVTVDGKKYAYPRYFFSQVSKDIQELFCRSCRQLGILYLQRRARTRGLDPRRESVARLDSFVGPKA